MNLKNANKKLFIIEVPSDKEQKKINDILAICDDIYKKCQIADLHKPLSRMLIYNLQLFISKNKNYQLLELLNILEENIKSTQEAINKKSLTGEQFLSYLGGLIQGIAILAQ